MPTPSAGEDGAYRMPRLVARSRPPSPRQYSSGVRRPLQPTAPTPRHRPRRSRTYQRDCPCSPYSQHRMSQSARRPHPRVLLGSRVARELSRERREPSRRRTAAGSSGEDTASNCRFCITREPRLLGNGNIAFRGSHRPRSPRPGSGDGFPAGIEQRNRGIGVLHLGISLRAERTLRELGLCSRLNSR